MTETCFFDGSPASRVAEVDANPLTISTHPDAIGAIRGFLLTRCDSRAPEPQY